MSDSRSPDELNRFIFSHRPFELTIGRLVMNFGALEASLLEAVAELLPHVPQQDLSKKVPRSFGKWVDKLDELTRATFPAEALPADHVLMMRELRELADLRHHYIHGAWFDIPGADGSLMKGKVDPAATFGQLLVELGKPSYVFPLQIAHISDEVAKAIVRFTDYRASLRSALSTDAREESFRERPE